VHNARIATFGERVEDTFLVSDSEHLPLTEAVQDTVAQAIRKNLDQG
jgi:[protein-PII] uridylyltransferase